MTTFEIGEQARKISGPQMVGLKEREREREREGGGGGGREEGRKGEGEAERERERGGKEKDCRNSPNIGLSKQKLHSPAKPSVPGKERLRIEIDQRPVRRCASSSLSSSVVFTVLDAFSLSNSARRHYHLLESSSQKSAIPSSPLSNLFGYSSSAFF